MNLNKVFVLGRLTKDPKKNTLPSGQSVANFGVATNRYWTDKQGEKQEDTEFHNIALFGRLADIASQYLNKGSLVLIEGRLRTHNWDDRDGTRHWKTEIIGERLQLPPKSMGTRTVSASASTAQQQAPEKSPKSKVEKEDIPVINEDEEEIDVEDVPF